MLSKNQPLETLKMSVFCLEKVLFFGKSIILSLLIMNPHQEGEFYIHFRVWVHIP